MASTSPPDLINGVARKKMTSPQKGRRSPDHKLLPPGWERVKSQDGAYYYWDKRSGKTTWRYPEEEVKAHQEKMKKHNYENIQLQMAAGGKPRKKGDDVMKNTTDQSEELVEGMRHTYVNVNTSVDHAHLAEAYVTVPPPPQVREEDLSPSNILPPAPRLPPRMEAGGTDREKNSPTPPLPERHYSDADIRMSPPPPLPQRQYSNDDTLSPPPLPERHYTASDIALSGSGHSAHQAAAQVRRVKQDNPAVNKDRSMSLDSESGKRIQYEISEMGNQYAVVTKGKSANGGAGKPVVISPPPPLPKRFRERFTEDSPYPSISNENINQVGVSSSDNGSGYVDIDHASGTAGRPVYNESIAYAVVKLDGDKGGQVTQPPLESRSVPLRRARTPRPYESAVSSTSSAPSTPSSADARPKRVPAYEEIVDKSQVHKVDADGYTEVKRSSTMGDYAEVKRNSTGNLLHTKSRTVDLSSHERLPQMKQQASLDQPPLFPPLPPRPSLPQTKEVHEYHTLDDIVRKNVTSESPEERKSPGEVLSQDSVFDSISRYDYPSHTRKLNAMNVTLRRNEDPAAAQGYAKLDLSKEALLLRSGVTLRRLNHFSLSSVSSFAKEDGTPEPEEGSEVGSGTTPEAASDEDDVLEPVNKCIESLKTSLGEQVDGGASGEPPVAMTKAPAGPPSWVNYKRRPHAYEEVIQGGSQDETRSGIPSLAGSSSEISRSMTNFDMDWDNSDMEMGKGGTGFATMAGSCSQPNLLREAKDGSKMVDNSFPHLVKPERVSEEAFQLRKARLKQHKYEDMDENQMVGGAGGHVGDVNVLTSASAVQESWLEGDKKSPPGKAKLPRGWEVLKDEEGRSYYWHVPTGKTQYARPSMEEVKRMSLQVEGPSCYSAQSPPHSIQKRLRALTFSTRYLGCVDVMESELIPGQCVEVVHACVRKLTAGLSEQPISPDQEKVVYLQVHNMDLRWLSSMDSSSVTLSQPINRIRVWGIGLDNERDFGYVARDHVTKRHKCHVFRCDVPARSVASALLESHQQRERKSAKGRHEDSVSSSAGKDGRKRYSTEGSSGRSTSPEAEMQGGNSRSSQTAKTPTSPVSSYSSAHGSHEHYERIPCTYMGSCEVSLGMGMEILNEAVDKLSSVSHRWMDVNVDVATSNVKISDISTNQLLFEHRVRFLCFLGIARDDRYCGYILDGGERDGEKVYYVHGFKKEPNTDRLCLALHTACQARYKRVLEAHPEIINTKERRRSKDSPDRGKPQSSSSSLFGRLGSLRKMKKSVDEEKSQGFVVQYCGYQAVPRQDGLDMVREVVQQLAVTKLSSGSGTPAHLVEFDISPSGLSLTDPQKKFFGRKHFSSKGITYVLRIRNYFAFVVKESGKFYCHVFLETEVDAGTIVTTIQRFLAPDSSKQHRR